MRFEAPDPERWVPDGYVIIHADSRGAGALPGMLDPFSPRETEDYATLITWAADQLWSSGQGRPARHLLPFDQPPMLTPCEARLTLRMFFLATAVAAIYWGGFVLAPLFPGTAWYDPEFKDASRRPLGFSPQQILSYVLCSLLVVAVVLAVI